MPRYVMRDLDTGQTFEVVRPMKQCPPLGKELVIDGRRCERDLAAESAADVVKPVGAYYSHALGMHIDGRRGEREIEKRSDGRLAFT